MPGPGPRESLLAEIDAEQSPAAKAQLYGKLSASLLADIQSETDMVAKTELTRMYARSEKNRAYCLRAADIADPTAAREELMETIEEGSDLFTQTAKAIGPPSPSRST